MRIPVEYVDALRAERWDGEAGSASSLGLSEGLAVVYDIAVSADDVSFSAFVSSGERPDAPADKGGLHRGARTIYTCVRVETDFPMSSQPSFDFDDGLTCPEALIDQLPADAQYVNPFAFNG